MKVLSGKCKWSRAAASGMALIGMYAACSSLSAQAQPETSRHEAVLALKPVGYWPGDEGEGTVLHDRSANANHGTIHHTPWRDGMLDFNSAFQWCQVPASEDWRGEGFSIGGWLFTRDRRYNRNGMLFMAVANPIRLWITPSVILRVRAGMELDVVSDSKDDAVGSLAGKDVIAANAWQHVLYTWKDSTARLYLNGRLVRSADKVPFALQEKHPLIIGSDADWWMLHPPDSNSLNGSVRGLVIFNRALSPAEVTQLQTATRPDKNPRTVPGHEFAIDRDGVDNDRLPLTTFADASLEARYDAMERMIWLNNRGKLEKTDRLRSALIACLEHWPLRSLAAQLLLSFPNGLDTLTEKISLWTETVANERVSDEERAACALALGQLKTNSKAAVPVLVKALHDQLDSDDSQPPRVENLLRNALTLALLDIDRRSEEARKVIGLALGKPLLETVDLSQSYLKEVRALMADKQYADAFFAFVGLQPCRHHNERYFSQGDVNREARGNSNERAYTPIASRDGITYSLGAGKSFGGVEPISPEEFKTRVDAIAQTYPEAKNWRKPEFPHLYRVKITKTMPDGTEATSYLAGKNFIFDGSDAKVKGWSIAIDTAGYLHIVGGQHNRPGPGNYIPGSWEQLGLSRDSKNDSFPNQMYFVSKRPGDISEFEFVGTRNNPRNIPAGYLNYMNWVQDNAGELFLYGRINVSGWQTWGMYHYDVKARHWTPLGGDACEVIADALAAHPDWKEYLHHNLRGATPTKPGAKSIVWAWQPNFYNYCRDAWGIYFDRTNRMHLRMMIRGLDVNGRIADAPVYAWSDDLGQTFHRADGSKVDLPLTINPAPTHNANANSYRQKIHWDLYELLLRRAFLK